MKNNVLFALSVLSSLLFAQAAWAIGAGPNYDPTKNMLFPAGDQSKSLYVSLQNSGEFSLGSRAKKKKGALKRLRDIEVAVPGMEGLSRISESGEGSLVKVRFTQRNESLNIIPSADGQTAEVFVRSKKGKVISSRTQISVGPVAYFRTFSRTREVAMRLAGRGPISAAYASASGLAVAGGLNPDAYVSLDADILTDLQLLTLAQIKIAVIAYGAYGQAIESGLEIGGRNADEIRRVFDAFSSIAFGTVSSFRTLDPDQFESQIANLISISREVLGLSEEGLARIVGIVLSRGSLDFDGIVETAGELIEIPVKTLTDAFRFVVEYSWPIDQPDLDTGTTFLGNTVGFAHADSAPFMFWTGDSVETGGVEVVDIDLFAAAEASALPPSFSVDCAAGWFAGAGGSGPAVLHLYLLNASTGVRFGEVTKTIAPGTQNGAATTPVGSGNFDYDSETGIIRFSVQ